VTHNGSVVADWKEGVVMMRRRSHGEKNRFEFG